jgi:hypothetical protein
VPVVLVWIVLAIIVGVAANTRGRNPLGWTLLALVASPLIAGLLVLALPSLRSDFSVDDATLRGNVQRPPLRFPWGIFAVGLAAISAIVFGIWVGKSPNDFSASPTALTSVSANGPRNGANDYLLALSDDARLKMLGGVVGNKCSAKSTFYMGIGASGLAKDKGFWTVQCRDGRAFAVEANPDGTSIVLECSLLKSMHAGECFRKLD